MSCGAYDTTGTQWSGRQWPTQGGYPYPNPYENQYSYPNQYQPPHGFPQTYPPQQGTVPYDPSGRGAERTNLPDTVVGEKGHLWWKKPVHGYGIDLDRDGKFTRGTDGVLALDFNKDGELSNEEIEGTNDLMHAMVEDFDFDRDGKVSKEEQMKGMFMKSIGKKVDADGDGKLDTAELEDAGGRVWIDANKDGKAQWSETHSPYRINTGKNGGVGTQLDYVDPKLRTTKVSLQNLKLPIGGIA